jgi:COP9 signalosome complex subunit 6
MSSSSGLTFKLHPLVIVNISDHYTRIKAQQSGSASRPLPPAPRVYGCVLGVQTGRTVEIFNSFELHYDATQNVLDRAFLESKQEQCKLFMMTDPMSSCSLFPNCGVLLQEQECC